MEGKFRHEVTKTLSLIILEGYSLCLSAFVAFFSALPGLEYMAAATAKNEYDDILKEMFGLGRFGIILGLATIRDILNGLDNPQNSYRCIHVAGTNGKGSIASALSNILHRSGYRVGLYTSPHLVRFNERICINNTPVSNGAIVKAYRTVKKVHSGDRQPTFFEYTTAMALYEFGRQKVDWAVIETGMGGRLDATNILRPALSIITNISLEHRMYLGNTIARIAGEKAGIIKRRVPVVTGVKQKSAIAAIEAVAKKRSAPLFRMGDAFRVRRNKNGTFTYFGIESTWRDVHTGLLGNYQIDNAALVLAGCEILNKRKAAELPLDDIRDGLENNRWPGRLETVSTSPLVLLDGAHNFIAARNLARFLSENIGDRKITLVVGMLDDKPYKSMLKSLLPVCSRVVLTRATIDRSLPAEILYPIAREMVSDVHIEPDVGDAVKHAIDTGSSGDVIVVAGSLYVVGEAKDLFEKEPSLIQT